MSTRKTPIYEIWAEEIERYCRSNGLAYAKLKEMGRSYNNESCFFQYIDRSHKETVLMDCSKPAPVVLIMQIKNGKPTFEQTEYTRQYLK